MLDAPSFVGVQDVVWDADTFLVVTPDAVLAASSGPCAGSAADIQSKPARSASCRSRSPAPPIGLETSMGCGTASRPGRFRKCGRQARRLRKLALFAEGDTVPRCSRDNVPVMSESDWTVEVLEKSDVTAGGEPFMGLMATRAPFDTDTHQETGPVLAVVRTGTDRDRIFIDLSHESGGFTFALGAAPGPTNASGESWLRIEAEDLWQDCSKVRILRFDVDWQAGWAQELPKKPTCIAVWRKDSDTPKDLWGPPEDRDGPELLSFLSKQFPVFRSADETGGAGTRGGSNICMTAVGFATSAEK
jgi:hypothetical protein